MPNRTFNYLFFLTLLIVTSCAQIVAPTGGNKDFTAPRVLKISPETKTTNFNKKKILIEFDEYIQLNTPEDLIIISPPIEPKPAYTNKGKSLEIKITSELLSNTTYTINFSTAVGDNKENNLLKDYNYVFSTGPDLDSGFISGMVTNSFNNKPEKDITVGLYYTDTFNDSTIIKKKPVYVAKTDETGKFKISNLPSKQFMIVAFKDESKNLKAENNEELAFIENSVRLSDTNSKPVQLQLFKPDLYTSEKITDTVNREPEKFLITVYKPKKFDVKNNNGNEVYVKQLRGSNDLDTFHIFTKMNANDTAADFTINNKPVLIRYKPILKTEKLTYTYNKQPELNDTIIFKFNNPVLQVDTSFLKLYQDSFQIKPDYVLINAFEYRIIYPWNEKTNYKLEIKDSAFVDLFGQFSKKDKANFVGKSLKDYATLLLHIKHEPSKGQIILQLVDETETKIIKQLIINQSQDINLDYVLPGTYKIKYIFDSNKNGEWDNGDFINKTQPEKVGYFKENLNIKAYWDLEQSILIE